VVRLQSSEIPRLAPDTVALRLLLVSILAVSLLEFVARYGIEKGIWDPLTGIGLARVVDIAVLWVAVTAWGGGMARMGLASDRCGHGFIRGGMWALGFGVLAAIGLMVMTALGYPALKLLYVPLPRQPGRLVQFFIVGGVVAPIAEEIFFRGIVYGFFRRWGRVAALIISTLAFVAAHGMGSALPVTQLVGGILFALAYEYEGNLMVPIVIHSTGNLSLFALSLIVNF
jgi:CAAX protease family protein